MDLSVIIVNYNTKDLLKACLDSLINNTNGIEYEVIVVDNSSSDGSGAMLKNEFPEVRIIFNRNNSGFAKANNQGIKAAKGDNILLLNSDTVISDNCLYKVWQFSREREGAGIIGCKVLNPDRSLQYSCYHKPNLLSEIVVFTKGIIKNFWEPVTYYNKMKYWNHNQIRQVDCVSGCFFWIKKKIIDEIGLLDEGFFMFYEDAEFCLRLKLRSKCKVFYFPFAEIVHLKGGSGNIESSDYSTIKYSYMSAQHFFDKCCGPASKQIFIIICRFIWRCESFLFFLLKFSKKCSEKLLLLNQLQSI